MAYTQVMKYETLRSIDSATFAGTYLALGTPLLHAASIVKLVNNSNVLVTVSRDGINDMDVAPANSFCLYDVTSNLPHGCDGVFARKGEQYYIKGAVGVGLVYLVVQYIDLV